MFVSKYLLIAVLVTSMLHYNTVWGFASCSVLPSHFLVRSMALSSLLRDSECEGAAPLPLTTSDLQRLTAIKSRHVTLPLLIMDAVVPGQTMSFASSDPKFHNLIHHVLQSGEEIGMLGLNPHTGQPINVGVTVAITLDNVVLDTKSNTVAVHVQARRRFEVQGEPWLHRYQLNKDELPSNHAAAAAAAAFYMANVEIIDDRPEEPLEDDVAVVTQHLADQIPDLVGEWVHHLVATNRAEALRMETRMMELGPLPTKWKDQAFWVAALLNPAQGTSSADKVCLEIRPAMLSCHSNYERMLLATAALQSSIDHISGKKKLF